MRVHPIKAILLSSTLLLGACDPGSDSVAGIEGTGGPATASGSVTSYGSIYVNGIHIDIGDADIRVNGALAGENDVRLGMVVDVEAEQAEDDSWVAREVRHVRSLRGVVSDVLEVTDVRLVLQILGQTLVVYDDALFDGVDFESLDAGTAIDVSGFIDAEGRVVASRVASASADAGPELQGRVQSVDSAQSQFALGELIVDYRNALFDEGERDQLESGVTVRVRGNSGALQNGVLIAEQVSFEASSSTSENIPVSREGVIREFQSAEQFSLAGFEVDASGARITGGKAGELGHGVRVTVSGERSGGVLKATEVRLVLPGLERIRARVDDVDPESGELEVLGTRYQSSGWTAFEDRRGNGNRFISLRDINVGETVEVHARRTGQRLIATRIKRLESDAQVSLRGPVTDIREASIQVMNVEVDLSAIDPETLAAFLQDLAMGDRVTVQGSLTGDQMIEASVLSLSSLPGNEGACPPALGDACDEVPGLDLTEFEGRSPRF